MEFASLLLLILLPATDAGTDMTAAIQATLYKDLGQVAIAVAPDSASSRKAWQEKNGDFRAKYVARFDWLNKRRARVELWRGNRVGKVDDRIGMREVTFSPVDATAERGRAMGLVIVQLLRELPEADLIMPKPKPEVVLVAVPESPQVPLPASDSLAAQIALSRAASGVWVYGPELVASIRLLPRFDGQAFASFGLGGGNGYHEIGLGLGAAYFPLQTADLRRGLGLALRLGLYREAAQTGGEDLVQTTQWEFATTPQILGYLTMGKSLRLQSALGLRLDTGTFKTMTGDDRMTTYTYSAVRPSFSLGVGLAF